MFLAVSTLPPACAFFLNLIVFGVNYENYILSNWFFKFNAPAGTSQLNLIVVPGTSFCFLIGSSTSKLESSLSY